MTNKARVLCAMSWLWLRSHGRLRKLDHTMNTRSSQAQGAAWTLLCCTRSSSPMIIFLVCDDVGRVTIQLQETSTLKSTPLMRGAATGLSVLDLVDAEGYNDVLD